MNRLIVCCAAALVSQACHPVVSARSVMLPPASRWVETSAPAHKGKQDDLHFADVDHGVYVNGDGDVFRTADGAATWSKVHSQPGTYWRATGFVDADHGFLGNIGTDYYPGVTDETPLYRTSNGGASVEPIVTGGPAIKGVCGIDVLKTKSIYAGVLQERVIVHVAGRVGGPSWLIRSLDGGLTWKTIDLNSQLAMVTDVKFFSEAAGYVVGATSQDIEASHAVILKTVDGGVTWSKVYESTRGFEMVWKVAFASPDVGYATVMTYDPSRVDQVVAKTVDGGRSWSEVALVRDGKARQFGLAFASAEIGWVGTAEGLFQTVDGGRTWVALGIGKYINKIRVLHTQSGFVAYAIGTHVYKLDARQPVAGR